MKYLKYFEQISYLKTYKLYHGSPFNFDIFLDGKLTFFSDTPKFAIEYADAKATVTESDDIVLYECIVEANLFDIHNEKDYKLLSNNLPDICEIMDTKTWFSGEIKKEQLLLLLKGKLLVEPDTKLIESIKSIYDIFNLSGESNICIDITNNDIKYMNSQIFESYLTTSIGGKKIFDSFSNYINLESFKILREKIVDFLTKKKIEFNPEININNYVRYLDAEYIEKYLEPAKDELRLNLIADNKFKSLNKESYIVDIKDNWNYYENDIILDIIKANYDGYIALEKGHKTYGIFNPEKCVKEIKKV